MNKDEDYNEILHWLAYTFPGVYRIWTDEQNNYKEMFNKRLK